MLDKSPIYHMTSPVYRINTQTTDDDDDDKEEMAELKDKYTQLTKTKVQFF